LLKRVFLVKISRQLVFLSLILNLLKENDAYKQADNVLLIMIRFVSHVCKTLPKRIETAYSRHNIY